MAAEADMKNSKGDKMGTVQITPAGPSQYKLLMKGPNRPDSAGKLIVSADGKTLTSETDTVQAGHRPLHPFQTTLFALLVACTKGQNGSC